MKIRSGFVSNSSTSSYVILGVKFDKKNIKEVVEQVTGQKFNREDYEYEDEYEDTIWGTAWNLKKPSFNTEWNMVVGEGICIVGKAFVSGNQDNGLDESVTDFEKMIEIAEKIEAYFGEKPKLYTGEVGC